MPSALPHQAVATITAGMRRCAKTIRGTATAAQRRRSQKTSSDSPASSESLATELTTYGYSDSWVKPLTRYQTAKPIETSASPRRGRRAEAAPNP